MARKVDDQRFADRLPGQTGAGGARHDRDAPLVGQGDRGLHVVRVARDQDGMRHHLVDAGVGAVQHAAVDVGAQLAGDSRAKIGKKVGYVLHRLA